MLHPEVLRVSFLMVFGGLDVVLRTQPEVTACKANILTIFFMHIPVCSLVTLAGHLHPGTALEKEPVSRKQACTVGRKRATWDPKEDLKPSFLGGMLHFNQFHQAQPTLWPTLMPWGGGRYNITGIRKGMI